MEVTIFDRHISSFLEVVVSAENSISNQEVIIWISQPIAILCNNSVDLYIHWIGERRLQLTLILNILSETRVGSKGMAKKIKNQCIQIECQAIYTRRFDC